MKTEKEVLEEIDKICSRIHEIKTKYNPFIDEKQKEDNLKYLETRLHAYLEVLGYDGILNFILISKFG